MLWAIRHICSSNMTCHVTVSDAQRYMYSLYHLAVSNHHLYVSSGGSGEQHRVLFISVESSGGLQVPLALLTLRTVCIPHAQQLPTVDVPKVYPASSTTHHQCCSVLVLRTCPEKHDLKHTHRDSLQVDALQFVGGADQI